MSGTRSRLKKLKDQVHRLVTGTETASLYNQRKVLAARVEELEEAIHLILVQRENFTDDAAHNIYKIASGVLKNRNFP